MQSVDDFVGLEQLRGEDQEKIRQEIEDGLLPGTVPYVLGATVQVSLKLGPIEFVDWPTVTKFFLLTRNLLRT